MKESCSSSSGVDMSTMQLEFDGIGLDYASLSADGLSSSGASFGDVRSEYSSSSNGGSSIGSSPLVTTWPLTVTEKTNATAVIRGSVKQVLPNWDDKTTQRELSEIDMIKEKFAKLLLGEDMSGGGKGVCSALAISNAVTNLASSVFGELWKLEPLSIPRKAMWKREMGWLLSVADHIVELVPSMQTFADGSKFEVMVAKTRSDLHANLPALKTLDSMLVETLDTFNDTEFWYVDQGVAADQEDGGSSYVNVQGEKWWLPISKVPVNGLTVEGRKHLQHQRESVSQILKAAVAINTQVLSDMEIPAAYWEALPKNAKACLGERMYRQITLESFSPEALLSSVDLSTEHKVHGVANRIETALYVWKRVWQIRNTQVPVKHRNSTWDVVKDYVNDTERRELLAARAESMLLYLKQKFPGLSQSLLDMNKIQYNKDVGQSILESYSRVLESLAFNIASRIDDVLRVDDMTKHLMGSPPRLVKLRSLLSQRCPRSLSVTVRAPHVTPLSSPFVSPISSPTHRQRIGFLLEDDQLEDTQALPDYMLSYGYEPEYESPRSK